MTTIETTAAPLVEVQDKFPTIPEQIDNVVVLQRGLLNHNTGEWEKRAIVRELNGYDEEKLSVIENRKDLVYADYVTEVLKLGVEEIGSIDFKNRLDDLTIGDRNALFLGIVRTTYGSERSFDRVCDECNKDNVITIDLYEDFELQEPGFDPTGTLPVKLRKKTVQVRPLTARDSLEITKHAKTSAEQSSMIISKCVQLDASEDPEEWAKKLNIADRNKIVQAIIDIQMGPKMGEVDVDCVHCGAKMPVLIDWLFLIFN